MAWGPVLGIVSADKVLEHFIPKSDWLFVSPALLKIPVPTAFLRHGRAKGPLVFMTKGLILWPPVVANRFARFLALRVPLMANCRKGARFTKISSGRSNADRPNAAQVGVVNPLPPVCGGRCDRSFGASSLTVCSQSGEACLPSSELRSQTRSAA